MTTVQTGNAVDAPADTPTFYLRHGTQDQEIFDDVVVNNQYELPYQFPKNSVIIDIGANVGAFAVACLLRGAGTVICFEPSIDNFRQLTKNVEPWPGQVSGFNVAVWRSDGEEELVFCKGGGTGSGVCLPVPMDSEKDGARIAAIGLDKIIDEVIQCGVPRVTLLKIDAEYSEYPILYTCSKLDLVDEIIGETHEVPLTIPQADRKDCDAKGMKAFLEGKGFSVRTKAESFANVINTLFFATRTPEKK